MTTPSRGRGRGRGKRRRATWFREDLVAWFLVLLAGGTIALGNDYWSHRRVLPADRGLPTSEDAKIVVLAFDRIVTDPAPNKISQSQLRRHLEALAQEGFVAVSLERLSQFYRSGEPLPPKSLVLTFDHGYLSSYNAVDPLLRELRWPAVLFIMTERQERRDPFFVYWDRVDRMVASGVWEIGSHGHRGHDPIVVDADGSRGPFFVRAMWRPDLGRRESWDEYDERVRRDHDRARQILSEHMEGGVLAYAPPLRDVAGLTSSPEAHRSLEAIVQSTYELAFFDDRFGVNDERSNPRRLRRLRVEPSFGTDELLRRIRYAMGEEERVDDGEGKDWASAWVSGSGQVFEGSLGELVATGARRADVWRAGSQWVEDWELQGDFETAGGEIWIVQESETRSEQWRFGGTEKRMYLQFRDPSRPTEVIASYPTRIVPGRWHHVRLVKRGAGLWIEMDGERVSEHPTYLPGRWRGNVGIVHWSPGEAHMRLRNLRFRSIPFRTRVLASTLPTEEIQRAIDEAPYLSALSPRIFTLSRDGLETAPFDESLLRILARRFAWEIVPTVRVRRGAEVKASEVRDEIARLQGSVPLSGLRVEWDGVAEEERARVMAELTKCARELSWESDRLVTAELEGEGER